MLIRKTIIVLVLILFAIPCSGCIRFAADAGYWHEGQDGTADYHGVGVDTQDLVPAKKQEGNITVA